MVTSFFFFQLVLTYALFCTVSEGDYLMQLAASLFGYAGEQGDHNALYTYAQLLRTGVGLCKDVGTVTILSVYRTRCES